MVSDSQFEFGDIIVFPRPACMKSCTGLAVYNHYGVYVGNEVIDGKLEGQDLFHHNSKKTLKQPNDEITIQTMFNNNCKFFQ